MGCGRDVSITELAEMIGEATGFRGRLAWDPSKPDGAPCRRLDVTRLTRLGWRAKTDLREGLRDIYRWFLDAGRRSGHGIRRRQGADPAVAATDCCR